MVLCFPLVIDDFAHKHKHRNNWHFSNTKDDQKLILHHVSRERKAHPNQRALRWKHLPDFQAWCLPSHRLLNTTLLETNSNISQSSLQRNVLFAAQEWLERVRPGEKRNVLTNWFWKWWNFKYIKLHVTVSLVESQEHTAVQQKCLQLLKNCSSYDIYILKLETCWIRRKSSGNLKIFYIVFRSWKNKRYFFLENWVQFDKIKSAVK